MLPIIPERLIGIDKNFVAYKYIADAIKMLEQQIKKESDPEKKENYIFQQSELDKFLNNEFPY